MQAEYQLIRTLVSPYDLGEEAPGRRPLGHDVIGHVAVGRSKGDGVAFDDEFSINAKTVLEVTSLPLTMAFEGHATW